MLCISHKLQGLAYASPQGALEMDKRWRNTAEMQNVDGLHFH
jgi:hypothetical protein